MCSFFSRSGFLDDPDLLVRRPIQFGLLVADFYRLKLLVQRQHLLDQLDHSIMPGLASGGGETNGMNAGKKGSRNSRRSWVSLYWTDLYASRFRSNRSTRSRNSLGAAISCQLMEL